MPDSVLRTDMKYLKQGVRDIKAELKCLSQTYVTKVEFTLVNKEQDNRISQIEKLVYGSVGLALLTLGKAILDLITTVKASP